MKAIQIETISGCNRSCTWCPVKKRQHLKMDLKVYKNIVDQLKDFEGRISPYLMNEPTLDDRLLDLVDIETKAQVFINTNGTGENAEKMIPELIKKIDVQINCYDKKTYDKWKHLKEAVYFDEEKRKGFYNRAGNVNIQGEPKRMCKRPFEQMYIDYRGKALLCCSDYNREVIMGDTTKDSLEDIFNNDKYKRYRKLHKQGKRNQLKLCKNCNYPTK